MRGQQPWRTNRSRVLRSQPISTEVKLWARLRNIDVHEDIDRVLDALLGFIESVHR